MFRAFSLAVPTAAAIVLSTPAITAAAEVTPTTASKPDQERIQGTWECVATIKEGKEVAEFVGVRAVLKGNQLVWMFPQSDGSYKEGRATFKLDEKQNPKHFDWHMQDQPTAVHRRLYVLAGDILIWSTNLGVGPRPESFAAGTIQFVMKRLR
jgi:uncharacterized protein (TIGR03067 family)